MKTVVKYGAALAAAAVASVALATSATAGGLFDGMRGTQGSVKDMPRVHGYSGVSRCYLRGDVGYSYSAEPVSSERTTVTGCFCACSTPPGLLTPWRSRPATERPGSSEATRGKGSMSR